MPRISQTNGSPNSVGKRDAILSAATKVFARKGFFNSKVSDIAATAGIADGTVYLYFKGKDDILHSLFNNAMSEFIACARAEVGTIEPAEDKLAAIARLHLARLGADRDLAVVFQVELRGSIKFMQEFSSAGFAEYLDIIRGAIAQGQNDGSFKKGIKPVVAAKIFYGALDEMVTNWILSARTYPLEPMAGEVIRIFLGGMLA